MTSPLISQNHSKGGKKKDEQSMLLTSQNSSEIELTTSSYPSFGTLSNKIMNSAADCFYPNDDTAKDNDNNLDREYANNDHDDDDTNSSSSGSSYHGWKLTIPAPTYYSTSKYNSQCIEIFSSGKAGMKQNRINVMDGGDTKNNQDQDATVPIIQLPKPFSETNNDQFDSSIGLGMQLSKSSTYEDLEEEEEDVALLSSAAAGKRSPGKWHKEARLPTSPSSIPTAAWTYEAPHLTNWNISSQSLLTITYKKSIHCIPDFTNRNVCYDYISRAMKFSSSTCTKRNISMMNGEEDVKSGCCGSANVPVYSEVYTEKDIINVNSYNIQITGFTGVCKAIQIQFRSKHSNSAENGGKNRFDYRNGKAKEQKLNEKLQLYLDRSKANQDVPFDGQSVLDEHDYGANNDYGLPLPPWDDKSEEKSAHGPIVTFAVPNLSDENQIDCLSSSFHNVIHDTVPLLWKVDFPPDPSIAIEAFTVLDGILDVHENSSNNDKEESDENKSTMSCSTCSTDECDASHPDNIYINGYQSWSFTGSVRQGETQPTSAMPDFLSKAFNYGADVPPAATINLNSENKNDCDHGITRPITQSLKRRCSQPVRMDNSDEELYPFHEAIHYTSDFYTCVSSKDIEMDKPQLETLCENSFKRSFNKKSETQLDEMGGTSLVLGFLSQRKQFGIVTFDSELERVAMHASLQGVIASRSGGISTDWAYCQILPAHTYDEEPMAYYLNAVSSYNNAKPLEKHPPLTGWCSWYHYYENIDLNTLKANFRKMSGLKSTITQDLAIIDDGYITAWGDWDSFKPKEFPKESGGMKALADNIEMNNMIPGLWMAPFACDKHSQIAKDHPDWIIRNDQGRVANSANCGKFFYGLDATNPEVRKFAFNSIHRAVKEWGYKCLKLDFLYAACLDGNGKYDLSMSRAETMYLALQTLRAAAGPDTFLIGCGCPLAPAIGYMDGMRISADTGPTWYPDFPLPWWDHATLPSLRAMIRNSTTRACLGHRWWHNDPDCILLGETTSLSDHEVVSAASIVAMTGGMLLLSDDLSLLTQERIKVATKIFPVTGVTAVVLDLHNTSFSGLPSLLRLWCTDSIVPTEVCSSAVENAKRNAINSAFSPKKPWKNPISRERNCVPVAKGLGTWSIVSLSNWLDRVDIVSVPIVSLLPSRSTYTTGDTNESEHGYHVFAFWAMKYIWVSGDKIDIHKTISKRLGPRETEIFHVKPVDSTFPQYIGSDLHFTCGYEVNKIDITSSSISLQLKNDSRREGYVYLYIPTYSTSIHLEMNGSVVQEELVSKTPMVTHGKNIFGGQIIRVFVTVGENLNDGKVTCTF